MAVEISSYCHYLGGHPDLGKPTAGSLILADVVLGIGTFSPRKAVLSYDQIASVEVTSEEQARRRVGAELTFGVLGGVGGRKAAKNLAIVIVRTTDGNEAYYQVDKLDVAHVRARLAPVLKEHGVPWHDEAVQASTTSNAEAVEAATTSSAPVGIADELAKLAALRDSGVLSTEEFDAQKAKLLTS
jgi:hypothetical protein